MLRKTVSGTMLTLLIINMLSVAFGVTSIVASHAITHVGDLIIDRDELFTIENCTYIQTGNIYVRENGTLLIKSAELLMNMSRDWEYGIHINDAGKLIVKNGNISTPIMFDVSFYENAIGYFSNSTIGGMWGELGYVCLEAVDDHSSNIFISSSTVYYLRAWSNLSNITISDSNVCCMSVRWEYCDLSIINLRSGLIDYWNSYKNTSILGECPNITIFDSSVGWSEMFFHNSKALVEGSEINSLWCLANSNVTIVGKTGAWITSVNASQITIQNNTWLPYLHTWGGDTKFHVLDSHILTLSMGLFYGFMSFDETMVDAFEAYESRFYMSGNVTFRYITEWKYTDVTRNFNVNVIDETGHLSSDIGLKLFDRDNNLIWSGSTDTLGKANFNLTFTDSNYTDSLRLEAIKGNWSATKTITFLSDTPVIIRPPRTIYVDDDNTVGPWYGTKEHPYQNIIRALEHDIDGDTIFVYNGTYHENVVVDKEVSLVGEYRNNTIIDGNGTGTIVRIEANNTFFCGFTVRNGDTGILLTGRFIEKFDKVPFYGYAPSNNNSICNNIFINNTAAICLESLTSDNHLINNKLVDNGVGLKAGGLKNYIIGNMFENNGYGICLESSSNHVLRNNTMVGNKYSFGVGGWQLSDFIHDIDTSNTVDGKPIYYWVSRHNEEVPLDAGYVALINCTSITAKNLNMKDNCQGILLAHTRDSTIAKNNVTANSYGGILLDFSSNNTIYENNITNNGFGVLLVTYIDINGIWIVVSSNNKIYGNNITNNEYGICLASSSNNFIYHNSFVDNTRQVYSYGSVNVWDDGYPSGGNYWSDYEEKYPDAEELDDSGIWDTPYVIDANNQDRYPLMNPWTPKPDVSMVSVVPSATEVYVGQVVNITVTVKNEGSIAETFSVTCKYLLEEVEHLIGTQAVTNLAPNTTTTLTFTWTTTDITVHTIKAEISPLTDETDTTDNTLTSPTTVKVKILGDVNGDNKIDMRDIYQAALAFGSYPNHPRWNPQADTNQDGKVDMRDLVLVARNFGKTHP